MERIEFVYSSILPSSFGHIISIRISHIFTFFFCTRKINLFLFSTNFPFLSSLHFNPSNLGRKKFFWMWCRWWTKTREKHFLDCKWWFSMKDHMVMMIWLDNVKLKHWSFFVNNKGECIIKWRRKNFNRKKFSLLHFQSSPLRDSCPWNWRLKLSIHFRSSEAWKKIAGTTLVARNFNIFFYSLEICTLSKLASLSQHRECLIARYTAAVTLCQDSSIPMKLFDWKA